MGVAHLLLWWATKNGVKAGDSDLWVKGEYFDTFDLAEIAAREKLDRAARPSLFERIEWFRLLWENTASGAAPLIVKASNGKAQAWLFLLRHENGSLHALANPQTLRFSPVFVDGDPAGRFGLIVAMARRLRQVPRVDRIDLGPFTRIGNVADLVERAFARAGWIIRREAGPGICISTDNVSAENIDPSKEIEILTNFDTLSWAAFSDSMGEHAQALFLRALAESESAAGTLRLGLWREDGDCRAAQLWTAENSVAILHHAFSHDPNACNSLGRALRAHMIQQDRIRRFEASAALGTSLPVWLDREEPTYSLRALNPSRLKSLPGIVTTRIENLVRRPRLN